MNLRVFVSSPGDVAQERAAVRGVVTELENSHLLRGKVNFEVVDWDDPYAASPMEAGATPQDSVNRYRGRPSDCDLTLVILWSRIGTPLPPDLQRADGSHYASGTVWEFEDASDAHRPVWLYRRSSKPQIDLDDPDIEAKRTQFAAVKSFFDAFKNPDGSLRAGINTYVEPADFARQLRHHLEAFVNARLSHSAAAQTTVSPDDPQVLKIISTLTHQLDNKDSENSVLRHHVTKLSDRVAALETQLGLAVARTLTAAAQPDASPAQIAAAAALQAGDTQPAEALIRDAEQAAADQAHAPQVSGAEEISARRRAAELAREQGALAYAHDVGAALAAYQRAADYEPQDLWTRLYVGDLQLALGDLAAARHSFAMAKSAAEQRVASDANDEEAQHELAASHDRIGNVLMAQGNLKKALTAYRNSLGIAEALAARDPASTTWQRDLSVSHHRIGNVLRAQGDLTEALATYRKGLDIAATLAMRDPTNTAWQRDLSISYDKIGNVLRAQGDLVEALAAYRTSLDIRESLAARDAAYTGWQRDLSVSHNKIGDVLQAQGDLAEALTTYRKSHAITETLAARDPANTAWQRDLSINYDRIGNVLQVQGDLVEALADYRTSLNIRKTLTARDPANTAWQRDLSISHNRIGDVLQAQGDLAKALTAYRKSLDIHEALAARDPANVQWQIDVAVSCARLGDHAGLSAAQRRDYLQRGLEILHGLKALARLPPSQDWIGWFEERLHELESSSPPLKPHEMS